MERNFALGAVASTLAVTDVLGLKHISLLSEYVDAVTVQHRTLCAQLETLTNQQLPVAITEAERLTSLLDSLEAVFEQIDQLSVAMDEVNAKTKVLNDFCKATLEPKDVKEKAASLLKSMGFRKKFVGDNSSAAVWARIPPNIILDESSPEEFTQRVHGVFCSVRNNKKH